MIIERNEPKGRHLMLENYPMLIDEEEVKLLLNIVKNDKGRKGNRRRKE